MMWTVLATRISLCPHVCLRVRVCVKYKCEWGGSVHGQANGVPFGNVTKQ